MSNEDISKSLKNIETSVHDDFIKFAQKLVQTKSLTCQEREVAFLVEEKMKDLGYDEVTVDSVGNVLGRIGNGAKILMFDSHMDTVTVNNLNEWEHDPFGAAIENGRIYGRGACDMKCALAASVYGGYIAKEISIPDDVTVLVSASCMEEDYDGEAVRLMLKERNLRPDAVIICEPTSLKIATGHRGRTSIEINVKGTPCHASNPNNGVNPVYLMTDIIRNIMKFSDDLDYQDGQDNGSVALTNIYCNTASNNSVPNDATIVLDRRLANGESEESISLEMNRLLEGTEGSWKFMDIPGKSWTETDFMFHSFLPAWNISSDHSLVKGAISAFKEIKEQDPVLYQMGASTNAVVTAGLLHIPTIIFGPGNMEQAHATDEYCDIQMMVDAALMYADICHNFS